jgi:hypothetical protein
MIRADEQLARLGFGSAQSEPSCWRVTRLDPPVLPDAAMADSGFGPEPAASPALLRWRRLLAGDHRRPSPYRIARAKP